MRGALYLISFENSIGSSVALNALSSERVSGGSPMVMMSRYTAAMSLSFPTDRTADHLPRFIVAAFSADMDTFRRPTGNCPNAMPETPTEGEIRIVSSMAAPTLGSKASLQVSDCGAGMMNDNIAVRKQSGRPGGSSSSSSRHPRPYEQRVCGQSKS